MADICNDELYILDPADDQSSTAAPTSSSALNNHNINYTMVTSSTGSSLSAQAGVLPVTGEGNTIVLFKPDDQQTVAGATVLQSQDSTDRSPTHTSQPQQQVPPKLNTSLSSLSTVHTMSPIESSPPYHQTPKQTSLDLKEDLDLDQTSQTKQPPQSAPPQRQHHNLQINAAILANRSIEVLSAANEHILFKAASSGDTASIAKLQREYSLLTLDSHGATVLHHAVFSGHLDMIQYLLRQDCSKELLKIGGPSYAYRCSVLHLAARCGSQTICSVLLAAGADPTALDHDGFTPAQYALGCGHNQISAELNRKFSSSSPQCSAIELLKILKMRKCSPKVD